MLILSDLHRELWYPPGKVREAYWSDPFPKIDPAVSRPDVVILAGDIDEGTRAVTWIEATFPGLPVVYVSGNHEGYGHNLDGVRRDLAATCAASGHIHYLEGREMVIDGVRFLGATLWADFRLHGKDQAAHRKTVATRMINDYQRIKVGRGDRSLQPNDTQRWHIEHAAWLKERIAEPFEGPTVVVTHMAPSALSISSGFQADPLSSAYASHLDHLVDNVDLWVHGHTHHSHDYRIGRGRVICNPLGYPGSFQRSRNGNPSFDPNLVVEV
ncbi:metallophosphoesterase [Pseudoxanthomonas jiangsuensis]|uniref:metallophosphoesterase n=1 Tax=Pseudoxanthomonas jiangsuensis TaxID=619688 RepID=UPI001B86C7F6|nr:metallophosphoesterase [Pseudoxanthomonas jiangsuensis]